MADHIVTPTSDIETRMGVQPLDELLAERDVLVKKAAVLRAKHAPFGTYDALRKIQLALSAQAIRETLHTSGGKMTETAISDAAHADETYMAFVLEATKEKAEWTQLENLIQGIQDTIMRGQAVARFVSSELHLA